MVRAILVLMVLACAIPARADIVATYRIASTGQELIFEVTDSGDFRSTWKGQDRYLLGVGDSAYIVERAKAARVSDYAVLLRERGAIAPKEGPLSFKIIESGTAEAGGWTGRAYYPDFGEGPYRDRLIWAISDNPRLKPLGSAFSRHYFAGLEMGEAMVPFSADAMRTFAAPMQTGTPIVAFIQLRLSSLDFRTVAADRVALPPNLETFDQLRARLGR